MADTREVARRTIEAFNSHDRARIAATNTPDALFGAPPDLEFRGREAVTEYAMAWLDAFPDARIEVHDEIIADDRAILQFTFRGTHTETLHGPQGDIPATGKPLAGRGVQILTIVGDEVSETQLYFDQVQVMTQLGLMPEPATA